MNEKRFREKRQASNVAKTKRKSRRKASSPFRVVMVMILDAVVQRMWCFSRRTVVAPKQIFLLRCFFEKEEE